MGHLMRCLILLLLGFSSSIGFAQTRVYVDQHGDDTVGTRFAFAFKEAVRKSSAYVISDDPKNSLNVDFVTLDSWVEGVRLQSPKGSASYVSVVVYLNAPPPNCPDAPAEVVIYHRLNIIGSDRATEGAESLLASIDKAMAALAKIPQ